MSEILNTNYKKVKEYDLTCPYCGCLARYKDYELSRYEDCYDTPSISYNCPNCLEYVSFPEMYLSKYDSYEFNQAKANHLADTIIESHNKFQKKVDMFEPIFYIIVVAIFAILFLIFK